MLDILAAPMLNLLVVGPVPATVDAGCGTVVLARLLVGVGTRYGSRSTSGHVTCGLSRLSPRSLAATLAFMAAGFAVVFSMRHVLS